MHDGMPYDPIQDEGQGHDCLKATQDESTVSLARDIFLSRHSVCIEKLVTNKESRLSNGGEEIPL